MKNNGVFAIMVMNAVEWLVAGGVAIVAINVTQNAWWALLLLIPAFGGYSYKSGDNSNKNDLQKERENDPN